MMNNEMAGMASAHATSRQHGRLDGVNDELERNIVVLGELRSQLRIVADRTFGSEPPELREASTEVEPVMIGGIGKTEVLINQLRDALKDLSVQINRMGEL